MRLRIDYFDQNDTFGKLLPRSGIVERTVPASDSKLTWYLIRLDEALQYRGTAVDRFIIASRWQGQSVGESEPTSVFILVVPSGLEVGPSFSTTEYLHVAWGMAHSINT